MPVKTSSVYAKKPRLATGAKIRCLSPMEAPVGAAVVGLGVGEQHARAYADNPQCRLLRLCDLNFRKAKEVAGHFGSAVQVSDWAAVLKDPEIDIVSIATYDDAHAAQVAEALNAGKNVFVEKPLCDSTSGLRSVYRAWQGGRRRLSSNLVLRAAPLYRWLREAVENGDLGKIYAIDGDYLYGRLHKITEGWRKNVKDYSVMLGGGIHMVDLMLSLAQELPDTVAAFGNRISTEGTAFRYQDFVAATFTFPSGLVGRITANFGCTHKHQHVLRVFGTRGTFIYDDQGARLHRSTDPVSRPEPIDLAPEPASKGALIADFVQSVLEGGGEAEAQARREFNLIAACLAAHQAANENKTVRIRYL